MKAFKHLCLPKDVHWIIEAKVHLVGEPNESFVKHMSEMRRHFFSKKGIAKRMRVYHKCARWTCDKRYRSKGMVSVN